MYILYTIYARQLPHEESREREKWVETEVILVGAIYIWISIAIRDLLLYTKYTLNFSSTHYNVFPMRQKHRAHLHSTLAFFPNIYSGFIQHRGIISSPLTDEAKPVIFARNKRSPILGCGRTLCMYKLKNFSQVVMIIAILIPMSLIYI